MHLLAREFRSLDEDAPAEDLGQSAADIVVLSFSDADLGALADAWQAMDPRPSLRLASLARLRHPMSVDLYLQQVAARARCVIVRLLGGIDYWRYGTEELAALCRARGIALALLPGDGRPDAALAELSTMPSAGLARLDACFRHGGTANARRALMLAADPQAAVEAEALPKHGVHMLDGGEGRQSAAIVFYRSHLLSADVAPIEALAAALRTRGLAAGAIYVASLKDADCAAFAADLLRRWRPAVVLNATGFSARHDEAGSPLDAAGVPVLQVVLAGSERESWAGSARGLSQADLAMQVVLPELDGRLLTGAVSFKATDEAVPGLEFTRVRHRPDPEGVALAADRAAGWARLAATPPGERRIAVVLSDYPGLDGQRGHAVGLDSFASLDAILGALGAAGYALRPDVAGGAATRRSLPPSAPADHRGTGRILCDAEPRGFLSLADYHVRFAALPGAMRARVLARWGEPALGDLAVPHLVLGNLVLALQPDRGGGADRRARYHDPDEPPCHRYLAFYLWLRDRDAMVHLGAHGSLEWLPGKAVALSGACFPRALVGGLPVIYPFIVNNPGEAAMAKRRLGAVTLGHMTPPTRANALHGEAAALERLIDEYAAADGLDRRRTALLRRDILDRAETAGLLAESGAMTAADDADALARLDAYLCDVKDLQLRDGLHVYGNVPGETEGLLAALAGRFVEPGPAGAPTRGRPDVLPTGRNLTAVDPRAVPTRSAVTLAEKAAEELLRRHLQDRGDWPRALVLDLWGSATMRTGGEDFALALVLLGVRPAWDAGSGRVGGFEVLPLALLDRPRVDVTLRISGVFRDVFEPQIALFDAAVRALAGRDETPEWNPFAGAESPPRRVYGPPAGQYGASGDWLSASAGVYGHGHDGAVDPEGLAARVAAAEVFVHVQDHAETDLLDSLEHAAHEGGFAAAAARLGAAPMLYHLDTARPEAPHARTVAEEVARIVRGRAANPRWVAGMMRHGYRGAAEIARAVEALHAFAATLPTRFDAQFDLLFAATLGAEEVDRFLVTANPAAREAMLARFAEARARGLWHPRRNFVAVSP